MHPKDFFENSPLVSAGHCFVIMPFADPFEVVYSAIEGALRGDELGFSCRRAKEVVGGGHVMTDVLRDLATAEVVIADLTGKNANVFYELGIAHTVKHAGSVLLITQTEEDVPFDVQHYRYIQYGSEPEKLKLLQDALIQTIKKMTPTRSLFKVVEGGKYESEAKVRGIKDTRFMYSFAIRELMLGVDSASYQLEVFRHSGPGLPPERIHSERYGPGLGEKVQIPEIPWALKLDEVGPDGAVFCVCDPNRPAA